MSGGLPRAPHVPSGRRSSPIPGAYMDGESLRWKTSTVAAATVFLVASIGTPLATLLRQPTREETTAAVRDAVQSASATQAAVNDGVDSHLDRVDRRLDRVSARVDDVGKKLDIVVEHVLIQQAERQPTVRARRTARTLAADRGVEIGE